jgi:hypothetical protein
MAAEYYLPIDVKLASRAGRLLRERGIAVRVVPSPPDVDPDCGFSLAFSCGRIEPVLEALGDAGIAHKRPVKKEV